jgi:uncharacterized protein YjbI with pentapeptide repeats
MNWTETRARLIEHGIPVERLPEEWQPGINLREANLTEADLTRADLTGANLTRANLTRADLTGADLTGANLRGADLTEANLTRAYLTGAYLTGAYLTGANLREAYLTGANLTGAYGPFTAGSFGRHHAVAAGGHISIGCQRHTYAEWLEHYEKIGRDGGYSNDEIADYGAWIRLAVARQRRIEQPTPAAVEPATE